jgi:hypothetical protein
MKTIVTCPFDNIVIEFKTLQAANKYARRIYNKSTGELCGYVKESYESYFGHQLKPGQKIYQVCAKD